VPHVWVRKRERGRDVDHVSSEETKTQQISVENFRILSNKIFP
jgi:hypothetical protein